MLRNVLSTIGFLCAAVSVQRSFDDTSRFFDVVVVVEALAADTSLSRRAAIARAAVLSGGGATTVVAAAPVPAAFGAPVVGGGAPTEGNEVAENVRRAASRIPGYGPPDVLYPSYFAGRWRATRATTTSTSEEVRVDRYDVRYVVHQGVVVADRAFNERSRADASSSSVRSVEWEITNPNVLVVNYADGSFEETKVTKRSFETTEPSNAADGAEGGGFFSSEYRRITRVAGVAGVPSIAANRVLTKWRKRRSDDDDNNNYVVEGIELVYADESVAGDPMRAGTIGGGASGAPKLVSKSRLRLDRLKE